MTATFLLWAGIAAALVYLPMSDMASGWPRSLVKTMPLVAFSFAAWHAGASALLVAALSLSAFGDFALSRRGESAFLSGLAAFALAHLAYVLLFLGHSGQPLWAAFTLAPLLAAFLVAVTLSSELWLAPRAAGLAWPVRAYVVVITGMGLAALTLPIGEITLGAGLFIASDVLLALQLFRMGEDNPLVSPTGWAVWGLYVTGQALILSGAAG